MLPDDNNIENFSTEEKIEMAKALVVRIKEELKMQNTNPLSKDEIHSLNPETDNYSDNAEKQSAREELKETIQKKIFPNP